MTQLILFNTLPLFQCMFSPRYIWMFYLLRMLSHCMKFCFYMPPTGSCFHSGLNICDPNGPWSHKRGLTVLIVHSTLKWPWKKWKWIFLRMAFSQGPTIKSSPAILHLLSESILLNCQASLSTQVPALKVLTVEWNRGWKRASLAIFWIFIIYVRTLLSLLSLV